MEKLKEYIHTCTLKRYNKMLPTGQNDKIQLFIPQSISTEKFIQHKTKQKSGERGKNKWSQRLFYTNAVCVDMKFSAILACIKHSIFFLFLKGSIHGILNITSKTSMLPWSTAFLLASSATCKGYSSIPSFCPT